MSIPESQLQTWSNQGAATTAENTYASIRRALESFRGWPQGISYEIYLQGSYRNSTNIRGDSDVDIVAELGSSFTHDLSRLTPNAQQRFHAAHHAAAYRWQEFRAHVLEALRGHYGSAAVTEGNRAIKVAGDTGRLPAHVVPCIEFRKYDSFFDLSHQKFVPGIKFWTRREWREVINYPKVHFDNGAAKNTRTARWYKPTVRMFKNARSHLTETGKITQELAPSYFVECLLYNATDNTYGVSFQRTYTQVLHDLLTRRMDQYTCQNEQQLLFGLTSEQWSQANALPFLTKLVELWRDW